MLLQLSQFFSPLSPSVQHPLPSSIPCPRLVHVHVSCILSSLASAFSILFLTFPCLFCAYQLYLLFPVCFSPIFPLPSPLITLHVISNVILFSSSCFLSSYFLGSVVDSCEFVVILLFIYFIIFYFLDKSL